MHENKKATSGLCIAPETSRNYLGIYWVVVGPPGAQPWGGLGVVMALF